MTLVTLYGQYVSHIAKYFITILDVYVSVPPAPADIISAPVNDTAFVLRWTPTLTEETRPYIKRYAIAYNKVGSSVKGSVEVDHRSNSVTIASLTADTSYRVKVRADTHTEEGVYSQPSRVRTSEYSGHTTLPKQGSVS